MLLRIKATFTKANHGKEASKNSRRNKKKKALILLPHPDGTI